MTSGILLDDPFSVSPFIYRQRHSASVVLSDTVQHHKAKCDSSLQQASNSKNRNRHRTCVGGLEELDLQPMVSDNGLSSALVKNLKP